jgi:hypothetical protein
LRFDFGPAGRQALEKLAASGPYKDLAAKALQTTDRWALREPEAAAPPAPASPPKVQVDGGAAVPASLMETIAQSRRCGSERDGCRLAFLGPAQAVLVTAAAEALVFERRSDGQWGHLSGNRTAAELRDPHVPASGRIEVRAVTKRQVFVGGKPVGAIFD